MTNGDIPAPPALPDHLVLFDGVCNLCNGAVQFIIRHDRRNRFRFAPLQSETGQRMLNGPGVSGDAFSSIVYRRKGKWLTRSTAVLHVARDLGGAWQWAYGLIIVPRFLRDAVYDLVARNRFRWFGRRDACMVPEPEVQGRFLS
ncbi:MAG: thiol-disulfide oxidoreductase DCC family protein [Bacteroidetes bacterium]|nr:thiol-disulfide oxidoreductase DCC family protein [Bacteroidota bacterium]MBS1941763.1 thiol-disulfide oxidoreductase DCC family protein [Bacteroidota bacterium]